MPGITIERIALMALLAGSKAQVNPIAMKARQGGIKADTVSLANTQQLLIERLDLLGQGPLKMVAAGVSPVAPELLFLSGDHPQRPDWR